MPADPFTAELRERLDARARDHLLRIRVCRASANGAEVLIDGQRFLNFASNDYLGLANHPQLITRLQEASAAYGVGSAASALMSGYAEPHAQLEAEIAEFTGRERASVFSSGYLANLGVLTALARRGDWVLADRLNHASLIDAAVLARTRLLRYPHRDAAALRQRLEQADGRRAFVVTDAVFSMDGDIAPLPELAQAAAEHQAVLVVDDAHGIGVLGPEGRGTATHFGLDEKQVPVLMGTFGKAFGVSGAFVAGPEVYIETILQAARTYIYTTAMPAALADTIREALILVRTETQRREHLFSLIDHTRQGATIKGISLLPSCTPIQPVVLGSSEDALRASEALREQGLLVPAIRPPTVPEGTARLRISLTAQHTEADIDRLLSGLAQIPALCT
jgi:8-amino-7-oxononanoate synthase